MIALVLLGFLACSSAAPHYHHHHGPPSPFHDDFHHHRYFQDDIFDTRSFWEEMRRELDSLDDVVNEFVKHFPSSVSSARVDGNTYKITIPLSGFDEKDIVVKAKTGLVMIQAVHKYDMGSEKTYMDIRTLPGYVNETGKWVYENEVLKLEFPLNGQDEATTEAATTQPPFHSREEMETDNVDPDQNADVGVERGDNVELSSNVVPGRNNHGVEATTYAVDIKDEVDFIPVRQVK